MMSEVNNEICCWHTQSHSSSSIEFGLTGSLVFVCSRESWITQNPHHRSHGTSDIITILPQAETQPPIHRWEALSDTTPAGRLCIWIGRVSSTRKPKGRPKCHDRSSHVHTGFSEISRGEHGLESTSLLRTHATHRTKNGHSHSAAIWRTCLL